MAILQVMEELLIEQKKYVSSKRAAQLTGYAKDYVGQLCREGRVPARLVGRSWYVLESAIQDHRFKDGEEVQKPKKIAADSPEKLSSSWKTPHYEPVTAEELPSINRLERVQSAAESETKVAKEEPGAIEHLHDAWQAWFDHVANHKPAAEDSVGKEIASEEVFDDEKDEKQEEVDVQVPIRAVYHPELKPPQPSEMLRSQKAEIESSTEESEEEEVQIAISRVSPLRYMQVVGIFIAVLTMGLAVIGSGYADKYVLSHTQGNLIAGVSMYKK